MKYDTSGINSKTNDTKNILLNSFLTDSGNSIVQKPLKNETICTSDYYNLFPIKTDEDLCSAINDKNVL
jgi:hypothetical protein